MKGQLFTQLKFQEVQVQYDIESHVRFNWTNIWASPCTCSVLGTKNGMTSKHVVFLYGGYSLDEHEWKNNPDREILRALKGPLPYNLLQVRKDVK